MAALDHRIPVEFRLAAGHRVLDQICWWLVYQASGANFHLDIAVLEHQVHQVHLGMHRDMVEYPACWARQAAGIGMTVNVHIHLDILVEIVTHQANKIGQRHTDNSKARTDILADHIVKLAWALA